MGAPDAAPTPASRARRPLRGTPAVLADGRAWTLSDAALRPALDAVRDRLFDSAEMRGKVAEADVVDAAWLMLLDGYDLAGREIAGLLAGVPVPGLWRAVADAMFGPDAAAIRAAGRPALTYSNWARSALLANGLAPAAIGPRDRPFVLKQLVDTGRAVPLERWAESVRAAGGLKDLLAQAVAED